MQTAGSGTALNGRTNTGLPLAVNVAGQPTTSAPGMDIQTPLLNNSPGGIRAIAPQVLAPQPSPPSPNQPKVQNIQLSPGMVLVRNESGQQLMIHQQTLAQMLLGHLSSPPSSSRARLCQLLPLSPPHSRGHLSYRVPMVVGGTVVVTSIGTALPGATQRTVTASPMTTVTLATETLENVKKCKNFLSTLIKLVSSGKQSSETAANVKDLVKDLLEGKIEAEDFTSRLYRELNSSPQPYLLPFLKRSLPALRQLTPDSAAFIQQTGLQQQASAPTPNLTMVVLGSPAPDPAAPAIRPYLQPVISKQGQPAPLVLQPLQQGAMVRPLQVSPIVTLRVPMVKPGVVPGSKLSPSAAYLAAAAQKNKLKEAGGTFRDDDDINDVASMAGVNLSEESACILATNSELVGAVTCSCKDEALLHTSTLTRRILEIGKKFGRKSEVAQQRNINFKEDSWYEQTSDMRAQLKFFEQMDQMEKQRKEEQQREIPMKTAKSRSRQEHPEQLRLKQKAKEMQQQELFQLRQKEANLTALAAIGPRKKRKMEAAAGAEGLGSSASASGSGSSGASRQFTRQRITRVNLRDLLFCLENERDTSHSHLIYRSFLK
ncbi:hypothetical protein J4Q44_G00085550 [Coregonus suidteri]|uniref:TAFH domain-containing protein n=1 Tax=Coregonus suidteri TaxID=861788 RepID=A0AAN8M409_9TELE